MKEQILILLLLFIGTMNVFSQLRTVGSDSERIAEYKKAIGLDTTVPDFDTNKIDAQVMGSRLANLLNHLLQNYNKDTYELQIVQILNEQNESLQHLYYKIKKMQFANASKQGDVMTVLMNVWPDKNKADVNQADMMFRFVDGVSDDRITNDLFSYMSRYVEAQKTFNLQEGEASDDSSVVVTNSFWDNWYGQVGVDMSLQNPYGSNFLNTFPNGKSFGLDIAVGKWFTPEIGVRGKFNWENGIFKSDYAKWIQSTYYSFVADIQFNLHNLFGTYNPDRKWNLSFYPRMGALINNTSGEGSPLIGLGLSNTYRLNNRLSVYGDIAYQAVSNVLGFATGVGSGSNGFFDINVGVQIDLGYNRFDKASNITTRYQYVVATNTFWDNWFVQAGLGMSLLNPYGANFRNVFPNGKTLGINVGVGKWFSPDLGLRGGFNWQNGIIGNNHLKWMDPEGKPGANHDGGGYVAAYLDVFFNFHNLFGGYNEDRIWNAILAPRVGLDSNRESGGASPLLGLVTEQTFRLNNRLKLFIDIAYQVTTSELMGDLSNTNKVDGASNSSSNGWFDLNVGIQYELGQTIGWNKPGEKRTTLLDASGHNWPRFIVNTGASVIVAYGVKTALKKAVKEERPDHSDNKSFPSGHASMAFAAARSIDKEFRKNCIWIPIAGYAAATAVGIERIANKHHHWYDVVAGAGIGIGSAELTWWLSDLMFGKGSNIAVGSSGNTVDVVYNF